MVYLDYNATTPCDQRVIKAMLPYFNEYFGNPASDHASGAESQKAVAAARQTVAQLIGAKEPEIIFTSCATESNNLALIGLANKFKETKTHIITSKIEHPSVLNPCRFLESQGYDITYLDVDEEGFIDTEQLINSIRKDTLMVSVIFANNEIGTIQNVKSIGGICRKHNIYFHTDAAQAIGHIPVNVDEMNIDLMSISAHKFGGPKGVGALFIRGRLPRVSVTPIFYGGGQERSIRSGTLNVPLIIGLAEACRLAKNEMKDNILTFKSLTDRLFKGLKEIRPDIKLNGSENQRLTHNLNVEIPGVDNKWLLLKMNEFCFATGSACSELHDEPSHVLLALGLDENRTSNCVRISVGKNTKHDDINQFLVHFNKQVKTLNTASIG